MTIDQAARALRHAIAAAATGETIVAINLFGIRYADRLRGLPLTEIAIRAGLPARYFVEIDRGIALARVVTPRQPAPRMPKAFASAAHRAQVRMPTIN